MATAKRAKVKRIKKSNVVDVKAAAANDKQPPKTPTEVGAARAEGLRLYKLAGKPKKQDFIKVFGKKGVAWTWEQRAKAVELPSAEACAEKFQSLLKKAGQ
jgi:hypothetical protein